MSEQRAFAVFDIDGTIIRWQLYHALADELARRGHLDPIQYATVRNARMAWKQRAEGASFDTYELTLVNLVNAAITGVSIEELNQACSSVLSEYKDQVYTYTRDLIEELKAKDYLLFAISGSQNEIVKLLASHYGFDDFGGTIYEVADGVFTGKADPMRSQRKPEFLKELVTRHDASWQGSIAVGDSESDIPMLSIVERPIAFNPSAKLFEHAKDNHWPVVIERKNMTYRLMPTDNGYRLED